MIEVFKKVLLTLNANSIDYMVVGSVAAMVYGEPRLTRDMDIVIEIPVAARAKLKDLFPEQEYYLPPLEIISSEIVRRGQFNVIDYASGLKIDFIIRKADNHALSEFKRKILIELLPGFKVYLATAEDVIIRKLKYFKEGGSEKHLTDIRSILANTVIDSTYLDDWVMDLGLSKEWETVKS